MKTETTITLTQKEAIEMLLKQNPHVTKFIIAPVERKFRHSKGYWAANEELDYAVPGYKVLKNGSRERWDLTLDECLKYVKQGVWVEIP